MTDLVINGPDGVMPRHVAVNHSIMEPSENSQLVVRILRIVKRRRWLLLGSVSAALIIGFLITLFMTPQYTARATLEIQRETNRIVEVRGVQQESGPNDIEFYQTQYGLLRAQSLAERVAINMRLYENAAFFEMFDSDTLAAAIREGRRVGAAERQERVRVAAGILLAHIAISPTRLSRLVDVSFTSPDPGFSAEVVNAWTRYFVEMTLARRFEATAYARRFLEQRLEQLRRRLEESERTLVAYAAAQRIVNISTTTTSAAAGGQTTSERSLVSEDLATLTRR
jgi:polysaccharide biosynthesis transport protein